MKKTSITQETVVALQVIPAAYRRGPKNIFYVNDMWNSPPDVSYA